MRILQISTSDRTGGAAQVAWRLHRSFRARGHDAWMVVGTRTTDDGNVVRIPNRESRSAWARGCYGLRDLLRARGLGIDPVGRALKFLGEPARWSAKSAGREDFSYPGTASLDRLLPSPVDVIHAHNLHGDYFDLRFLPSLSRSRPFFMTLHDAWLLSGHCAHSFACERWRTGCGSCPDLSIPPAVPRDGTAENWREKARISAASRLHIATPSSWLMDKVKDSHLMSGSPSLRVIPNGIDLAVFRPGSGRDEARRSLGLSPDAPILLFTADSIRDNPWKDFRMLGETVDRLGARGLPILCLAVGDTGAPVVTGSAEIRFIPLVADPALMARYYAAADLYLHPSRADTFPTSVIEALASGTPVIASRVGGIPEQVKEGVTGHLVTPGDAEAMAEYAARLLGDPALKRGLGEEAARDAARRFSLEDHVRTTLDWYAEVRAAFSAG